MGSVLLYFLEAPVQLGERGLYIAGCVPLLLCDGLAQLVHLVALLIQHLHVELEVFKSLIVVIDEVILAVLEILLSAVNHCLCGVRCFDNFSFPFIVISYKLT